MASARYVGQVLKDGHLSLPETARDQLRLAPGAQVQVVVQTLDEEPLPEDAYGPLRAMIGIGKGGTADGAVNHDKYLYGTHAE